jgi:hypothetical protein
METIDQGLRMAKAENLYQTTRLYLPKHGVSTLAIMTITISSLEVLRVYGFYVREIIENKRTLNKLKPLKKRFCSYGGVSSKYGGLLGSAVVRGSSESNIASIVENPHDFPERNIIWFSSESPDTYLNSCTN